MNRRLSTVAGVAAVLVAAAAPVTIRAAAADPVPAVRILTLGDSITAGGQWPGEVCRLVQENVGRPCHVDDPAVSGTGCTYWPTRIANLLATYQPDIVTVNCGTNDDVNAAVYGEPVTSWSWRYTVEAIHNWRPTTLIVPSFIMYSDPLTAPQWLLDSEPTTNDRIYVQYIFHQAWFPAIADLQQIPATADYLDPGGIHPTDRGYTAMGRIEYEAMRVGMGWPTAVDPPLCGMYGHRRGYPRPAYVTCPDGC